MRNLVTGGGFLGSHLIEKLLTKKKLLFVLITFIQVEKKIFRKYNFKNLEIIRHDVTEPIQLEVDRIWHLACPASPIHYQKNPIKTAKTSFLGTYNMLGLARRVGARILLASTSEIYGNPEIHPQPEDYWGSVNPVGIRSCYDEGKRIAETLCSDYKRIHNIEVRIARIFNTYGPTLLKNDGRVISNFIVQSLQGNDITIYGDGSQTRSFCYVDDLISGLIKLMDSNVDTPTNIGGIEEYKINKVAEIIRKKINPKISIINKPLPQDDPIRKPNIQKAKSELGWHL